ncbi:hypothetical protein [Burkholderia gladioli]|uniref:hypothetical protein n=1 Tax=Burkholderia gladioli TaxID=28095 RepID=UPI0022DBEE9F|nr:hypothetical protein [Burkholderia gladioli]MDA0572313.1 hypothetical protein [Burkholderia gladioli]MDA0600665.1 hypothetical protein [Burkholderia gladioli]
MFMEVDREIVKGKWMACARDLCRELTSRVVEWGIHELGERAGMGRESGCVVAGVRVVGVAAKLLKMLKLRFACHVAGRERVKIYQAGLGAWS